MSTFGAREHIRRAVFAMVRDGDDARVVRRPVIAGNPDGPVTAHPQPLPAIAALADLRGAIRLLLHEQARYARGDGGSWLVVGEALYGPDSGMSAADLAAEAFAHFAYSLGDAASFAFTCRTCGGSVIDRGPETGGPADAEEGHAPDCARFAAMVRAYEQE
jgi:hypothetical protein